MQSNRTGPVCAALQVNFDNSFFKAQKLDVLQIEVDGRLCVVNALKAAICHQNVVG